MSIPVHASTTCLKPDARGAAHHIKRGSHPVSPTEEAAGSNDDRVEKDGRAGTRTWDLVRDGNPYPSGLEPFGSDHSAVLFGREEESQRVLARLRSTVGDRRFAPLEGPSGCGNTSLLRAAILLELRNPSQKRSRPTWKQFDVIGHSHRASNPSKRWSRSLQPDSPESWTVAGRALEREGVARRFPWRERNTLFTIVPDKDAPFDRASSWQRTVDGIVGHVVAAGALPGRAWHARYLPSSSARLDTKPSYGTCSHLAVNMNANSWGYPARDTVPGSATRSGRGACRSYRRGHRTTPDAKCCVVVLPGDETHPLAGDENTSADDRPESERAAAPCPVARHLPRCTRPLLLSAGAPPASGPSGGAWPSLRSGGTPFVVLSGPCWGQGSLAPLRALPVAST